MNLAKMARQRRWKPGRTWLRLMTPDGEERLVRLTGIGETAVLVRRRRGAAEVAESGEGLLAVREEYEPNKPIEVAGLVLAGKMAPRVPRCQAPSPPPAGSINSCGMNGLSTPGDKNRGKTAELNLYDKSDR
jgi:hypothetical protein